MPELFFALLALAVLAGAAGTLVHLLALGRALAALLAQLVRVSS